MESWSLSEKRARNDRISKTINDDQRWSTYIKVYAKNCKIKFLLSDQSEKKFLWLTSWVPAQTETNANRWVLKPPKPWSLIRNFFVFLAAFAKEMHLKIPTKTLIHKYFWCEANKLNKVMLASCWILAELKVLEPFVLFAATCALHFTSTSFSTWDIGLLSPRHHKRLSSHTAVPISQRYMPQVVSDGMKGVNTLPKQLFSIGDFWRSKEFASPTLWRESQHQMKAGPMLNRLEFNLPWRLENANRMQGPRRLKQQFGFLVVGFGTPPCQFVNCLKHHSRRLFGWWNSLPMLAISVRYVGSQSDSALQPFKSECSGH